ncbi:MAG: peptidoglycan DD-metalloendopeptidase family protein [Syntrophomonadaceae bacterium]|nr:peptidoglycan DD-metalloendopeptidase family protein [Syntrophomonadaceae bacterium]
MKHKKIVFPVIIGLIGLLTYLMLNIVLAEKTKAYQVKISEKPLFIVKDKSRVEQTIAQFIAEEEERIGHKVNLANKPTYQMVLVTADKLTKPSAIPKMMEESLEMQTEAAQILVDGKSLVCLPDEPAAQLVLEEAKKQLTGICEGEEICQAELLENVDVKVAQVSSKEVLANEEAVTFLVTGNEAPVEYIVKEGDSLWMIARNHDTRVANLKAQNNLTSENLQLGQVLKISSSNPYITVSAVVEGCKTEAIPYSTKIIKDASVTTFKEKQKGQNGEKKVTYRLTKENGKVIENKVLEESVISQPVERIVVEGTRSSGYAMTASRSGSFVGGLSWPLRGAITSHYGTRGGKHTGMDINGNTGDPIRAAKGGTVTSASRAGGYGLIITINHGDGLQTRYAHCSKFEVSVGAKVSAGQIIARVGSTGNSTGSHLHFEVIQGGSYRNPLNYLR